MRKQNFCAQWTITDIPRRHVNANAMRLEVNLPYDITVHTRRRADSLGYSHSGYWNGGDYRFVKTFRVPEADRDKLLTLEFEGVYMNAMVYVNGELAAQCPNGYTNFYVPLNDHIRFGEENTVVVFVKTASMPNSRWYPGTGIYRPVWLYTLDRLHVPENGVRFTTEDVRDGRATVRVDTTMRNDHADMRRATLETEILDADGKPVASGRLFAHILSGRETTVSQRFVIDDVRLWSAETPELYTVVSRLCDGDRPCDESRFTTGVRTLTLNPRDGLCVNGESVKLRGACIHHTSGFIGASTFACEEFRKVRMLKEAGFNAIRIAHQPCSKDMLAACDALGMYLMEESFDQWETCKTNYDYAMHFRDHWEQDVEAFVAKDYNHPSVVLYSIGNEIAEVAYRDGAELARRIANKVRSLDGTRYITNAINGMLCAMGNFERFLPKDQIREGSDVNQTLDLMSRTSVTCHPDFISTFEESTAGLDIVGYNYMQSRYDMDCTGMPDRVFVGSETFPKDVGYNWVRVLKYPNLLGDFTWTGMEYLGEAGIARHEYDVESSPFYGEYPNYFSGSGDITLTGDRLPISYFREVVFGLRKAPYIAVWLPEHHGQKHSTSIWGWSDTVHSWRWPGFEGKPISVEVYSNAEEVELLVNGRSQGRQRTEDFRTTFETVYEPGEVVAISYAGGVETGRQALSTAGDALRLNVEIDRAELAAGAQDLAHVTVTLTDDKGLRRMDADRAVTLTVTGAGTLEGFGSDDPVSTEELFETTRTTYRGRALAFIRSGLEAGEIRVGVDCEGFEHAEYIITVR